MNENQESKMNQETPGASISSDLLAERACNQAAKMAGIIERVMTATSRYCAASEEGLQRQFALSAYGLICGMGDMMNARDMVDHEDLEGVEELCKELQALLDIAHNPIDHWSDEEVSSKLKRRGINTAEGYEKVTREIAHALESSTS